MRNLFLSAVVVLLAALGAVLPARSPATERHPHHAQKKATAPAATAKRNPCADYGTGFAPIAGTSTCIKVGGSISYEAGSNVRR